MEGLLIATGFTGALTLVYLARMVIRFFRPPLSVEARFSPTGGCTEAIVREIAFARREILVLAYGFTSRPIAQALVEAKSRAVDVSIVLDHSNEKEAHTELPFLIDEKLEPLIDTHHAIAHNKVMIIDRKTIVTGSFNFTVQAESHNAENLLIIKDHPELVAAYRADFNHHKAHARKVESVAATVAVEKAAAPDHKEEAKHHTHAGSEHHGRSHPPVQTEPEEEETSSKDKPLAPVTTLAAAELFARLRRETGGKDQQSKAA